MSSTPTDEPPDQGEPRVPPPPPYRPPGQYGQYGQYGQQPVAPPPPQYGSPPTYGQPAAPSYGPPVPAPYGSPTPFGQPLPPYAFPGAVPQTRPPLSSAAKLLGWLIAALGALTFVFAFLPWATVGDLSVNGIGGEAVGGAKDGVITLTLGVVCVLAGLVRALGKRAGGWQLAMPIVSLVMGTFITLTALVDIGDISDQPSAGFFVVSVGSGLYLTLAAGIALMAVSIAALIKRR